MNRKLATGIVCVAVLGIAGGQPPPKLSDSFRDLPVGGGGGAVGPLPTIPAVAVNNQAASVPRLDLPAQSPAADPVPPTFDVLVKELQSVRTQKAELEKREKAITEALLKKFAEQKGQLEKLGIAVSPPAPAPVPEVSFDSPPILAPTQKGGNGTPVK